jgi:quercetin dioxygenase-like cupin family protein
MKYKIIDLNKDKVFIKRGIGSRVINKVCKYHATLFFFDAGQEMSEHAAPVPAIMHFLEGRARVTLGKKAVLAGPGTWIHMTPNLPHAIEAKTRVVMLLTMFAPQEGECGKGCVCHHG